MLPTAALRRGGPEPHLGSKIKMAVVGVGELLSSEELVSLSAQNTSQTPIQGFELAHPSIYTISELLESMKDPVLQGFHDNNKISERSSSEFPASIE